MKPRNESLTLYIPDKFKEEIFWPVKQWLGRKRKGGVSIPLDPDLEEKWQQCIQQVEHSNPATVKDFWTNLVNIANQTINLEFVKPEYIAFSRAPGFRMQRQWAERVYIALIQSAYDQFVHEKDLHKCSKFLHDVVNEDLFDSCNWRVWQTIETYNFKSRLQQHWTAYGPLIAVKSTGDDKRINTRLLFSLGIRTDDFIKAFFSENLLEQAQDKICYIGGMPAEMIGEICNSLPDEALSNFRLTSKSYYNLVEKNPPLRMRHRLQLYEREYVLNNWIGEKIDFNHNYLFTTLAGFIDIFWSFNNKECRIISCSLPIAATSYEVREITIGAHIYKDKEDKINVLVATMPDHYADHIKIERISMSNANHLLSKSNLKSNPKSNPEPNQATMKIKHGFKKKEGYVGFFRKANIQIQNDEVTVNATLNESKGRGFNPREHTEKYRAKFNLSDFDSSIEKEISSMKV